MLHYFTISKILLNNGIAYNKYPFNEMKPIITKTTLKCSPHLRSQINKPFMITIRPRLHNSLNITWSNSKKRNNISIAVTLLFIGYRYLYIYRLHYLPRLSYDASAKHQTFILLSLHSNFAQINNLKKIIRLIFWTW